MRTTILLALLLAATAPGQTFIDFETIPGGAPSDGLLISNQFQAAFGVTFSLEGGGMPQLAKVGAPRTAFQGFGGAADTPAPGENTGQFFLTDDGVVAGPPAPLLVDYDTPVAAASGVILDIDFAEAWTVEARDAADAVISTVSLTANGNGLASAFSFNLGVPVISRLRIEFTGGGSSIGLAFDDFSTSLVGAGIGQPNSGDARLEINGQGLGQAAGPFDVQIAAGSAINLDWEGPPSHPVILLGGPVNAGAIPLPCFGSIDVGTPPTFGDLVVVLDGTVFPQSLLMTLDAAGQLFQSATVPPSAAGVVVGFQGAVLQPATSPCFVIFTAAFEISIL